MKRLKYVLALMPLMAAFMFISSCQKEDKAHGPATTQEDPVIKGKILNVVKHLPKIASERRLHRTPRTGTRDGGWSFADPGQGFSYTTSNGVFVYSESTNTLVFAPSASGGGAPAGGTVVAGETSLDINYAFCFSSDNGDNALGSDLFSSTNASTTGVSGVIGVSGDFDELQNADSTTEFTDIFHGLAFYFVYDGSPQGQYDVVDWQNVTWSDSTTFDNKCFAFIFDFQNGRLFLSSQGSINVSGGSMTYSGNYYEVSGFLDANGDYDLSGDNLTYREVDGFGTMGCN
jgi:hypothetical protein